MVTYIAICVTGIAPWKIAQLSACLYLWDIMWKQMEVPVDKSNWKVKDIRSPCTNRIAVRSCWYIPRRIYHTSYSLSIVSLVHK